LFTAVAYGYAGLFTQESMALIPMILPSIAIGVPIGAYLIQHIRPETFRRVCMSFDAWVVAFGISTLLRDLRFIDGLAAFNVLLAVIAIDAGLLYRFFHIHAPRIAAEEAREAELRAADACVFDPAEPFAVSAAKPAIE
jgi:ABC-type spermidine/putrescine transport system permease subunit II